MALKIELCKHSDIESLVTFIDEHWKKDHIFVHDRKLLDWQHRSSDGYNFVVASDDNDIVGILGFIPTAQYSAELAANNELWLAIWKVKEGIGKPGLGLMMLNYLKKQYNNPTICSLGLSAQVLPIYKALKYTVGVLSHRAFFNQNISDFLISDPQGKHLVDCQQNSVTHGVYFDLEEVSLPESLFSTYPQKDLAYINQRYFNHPSYTYKLLVLTDGECTLAAVVYREIVIKNAKIARAVDVVGENITNPKFNDAISAFIAGNGFEYMDLVSNIDCLAGSGFIENSDELIIPNYFAPFVYQNIKIDYAYKSRNALTIFIGDSDQDRPSC
ncbi:hypothetical protein A3K86_01515 [Photobacterium jeanii]|uniref:N-acetyltransferase domain-containing protein n=1 Tax=Photobacterium jeanii TaxID=858640 RepID=A0A178KP59_9GAMM|nr:hypothetical protein [Photobacterium jeanii]OAN19077.1 hypothetical protein A3K86_01515 [Photobacterium jeanii]PST87743.1 hypothetical protein C9I91_19025 [Photobacterium jeanii]